MPRYGRDDDRLTRLLHFLAGKLSDEDSAEVTHILDLDSDAEDDFTDPSRPREFTKARSAMDSLAMDAMPRSAAGQMQYRIAARICAPVIGEDAALACDSAESLVRTTLRALGVANARHAHPDALAPMLKSALRAQHGGSAGKSSPIGLLRPVTLAADGADNFDKRFPNVAAVRAA